MIRDRLEETANQITDWIATSTDWPYALTATARTICSPASKTWYRVRSSS